MPVYSSRFHLPLRLPLHAQRQLQKEQPLAQRVNEARRWCTRRVTNQRTATMGRDSLALYRCPSLLLLREGLGPEEWAETGTSAPSKQNGNVRGHHERDRGHDRAKWRGCHGHDARDHDGRSHETGFH